MALTQVSTGGIKDGQVHTADLADGQITASKLHADALDITYTLGASGTDHYTFTGEGLTGAVNDPTLYLTRGKTYNFVNGNSSGAHPFRIQSVAGAGGTEYNTGVTNNAGGGGSTIIFEVPHDAPEVLYYICTSHATMNGIFYITGALADGGVTTAKIAADAVTGAKIADDAVDSEHFVDGSIDTAHIADDAVTDAKLANSINSAIAANTAKDLSALSATNLTAGTIPDARFPATLPAVSGANLTGISAFVTGMILIWSGAANAIPTGWVLCDGTNGAPNLQGRFVVGYHSSNGDYDVGDAGGVETVTLTESHMPAHTHTATTKGTSGSHSWTQFGAGRNDWNYPGENSRGSATTHSTGGGTAHENRPPYYALCYIMKT